MSGDASRVDGTDGLRIKCHTVRRHILVGSETGRKLKPCTKVNSQLTLEILHDVQKLVVHLRLVRKLQLNRVEVTERVAHVERAIAPTLLVRRSRRDRHVAIRGA